MREGDCLKPCDGDRTQACGGNWRIAVYENPQYIPSEYFNKQYGLKTIKICRLKFFSDIHGLIKCWFSLFTIYENESLYQNSKKTNQLDILFFSPKDTFLI